MGKYTRLCPKCGTEIKHSEKSNRDSAVKKGQLCRKCGCNTPERIQKQKELFSGTKNPFYGKKHSQEMILRFKNRKVSQHQMDVLKSGACAKRGKENGMYGRSIYSVWVEKYGKEEADKRQKECSRKKSEWFKFHYDPSTHKSPPFGCGSGWGGWYNGWYFRSLAELTYMIEEIEKNHLRWSKGESSTISIFYEEDGKIRRYFPDFIIGSRMIEIKPVKLMGTKKNQLKKTAAEKYCQDRGMTYEQLDAGILTFSRLVELTMQNKVIFDKKTFLKFEKAKETFNKKTETHKI